MSPTQLAVLYLVLALTVSANTAGDDTTFQSAEQNITDSDGVHESVQKWKSAEMMAKKMSADIVKKVLPMMLKAQEDLHLSPKCTRSMLKFLTGLKQMKLWAFKMLDSSGKLPNGLLHGNINSLGDFDECLEVDVPGNFQGRYCTIEVLPPLPPRRPFTHVDDELPEFVNLTGSDTFLSEFLRKSPHYYYLSFRSAVCVPSTCSVDDVTMMAEKVMEATGLGFGVAVPNCETVESVVLTTSEIAIICVLSVILSLCIAGTIIDVVLNMKSDRKTDSNKLVNCLICFSFYTNTVRLLKEDNSPDTIKIFHGMKVITVLWVILNHNYYYINFQACSGLLGARQMGEEIPFQLVANGFLNVETFFFISAVLVAYGVMKMKERNLNVFLYVFRRLWRLTPPFMLVIATAFLIPHLASGPVWRETVIKGLVDKCKANWWTNLLYFNNLIGSDDMCFQWLWYIPVDTHLYFLALVVLIPLRTRPYLAFILNGVLFAVGIISTAVSNVHYELHPTAIYAYPHPDDINYFVNNGYFRTYLHITTYCVGMTAGYIIATRQKLRIPLTLNIFGWVTAFVMSLSVLYGVYDWNQGNVPGIAMSTVYTCTNKLVWSLALSWVTITCYTGNGGIANSILCWKAFVPLSRLTYMAYLIHPIIQFVYVGSTRVLIRTEHRTLAFMYLGHVVAAFMFAYVFSLLFESPFMALEKVMFSAGVSRTRRDTGSTDASDSTPRITSKKSSLTEDNGVYAINVRQLDATA